MKKLIALLSTTLLLSANAAYADECTLNIDANDMMQFSTKTLSAPKSCKQVTAFRGAGKLTANVMGHNWVLSTIKTCKVLSQVATQQGLATTT
ncbi:plastocyanin/azurin family copper-binding protein [Pseudoalteromonas tetraodonis]|uniref:plastocyanin/azurin family copper-binding protein n=1 Tax=Pseudoalteromonas tetraodonis TaxID=43659 RepID=UPI003CFF9AAA